MEPPSPPAAGRQPERALAALLVLLAMAAAWYGWLIFRTSFVSGGERVFCLFDDAMVSMTYARNLLEGHGLNWSRQGAPVEGFTHPLWTAVMVAANALPLPLRLRSLPVQLLAAGLLLLHVVLVRRLVRRHFTSGGGRTWLPAAVLTAFCYPLAYWSLVGMETALQAVLATASVLLALDAVQGERGRHATLWLLAAAAYLLRMDMVLLVATVQAFLLTSSGVRRQERGRWLAGAALFVAIALGYELFRWLYFGDLLPNTYYLKLSGIPLPVRLLRGLDTLGETLRAHLALLLPVGLGTAVMIAHGDPERREGRRYALPAAVFLVQCAYSVWIGGDAWEMDANVRANRFLAFVLPLVFVLGNGLLNRGLDALGSLRGRLRAGSTESAAEPRSVGMLSPYLAATVTAVALLLVDGLWLSPKAGENWRDVLATSRPLLVVSHEIVYSELQALRRIASPGATVAAFWAGIPAYFSDYRMVDLLGYNDRHIARSPVRVELNEETYKNFRPGHVKWDAEYVLDERRPDAFLQVYGIDDTRATLRRHGYRRLGGFWVRQGSPWIPTPARMQAPDSPPGAAGPLSGVLQQRLRQRRPSPGRARVPDN